ncbi:MAG: NUDIX domain-containing protein [Clostridia bacterium]|jgi:NAD+ diphosphatase|nr:NUDIX domain-containing protein [Clostridia bacterium]
MFCTECGEKLTLMFANGEGLVPYCKNCKQYRFAQFATAVSMVVTNRAKDKILLARHVGQEDFILFAGYVKKGETAEKTVTREFKEETKLNAVKYKYMSSRYHEPKNVLMLNFIVVAEDGEPVLDAKELEEVRWFAFEDALEAIRKDSVAEAFLKSAVNEIKKL